MPDSLFWTSVEGQNRILMKPSDRILLLKALRRMFRRSLANHQYMQARATFNLASSITPLNIPANQEVWNYNRCRRRIIDSYQKPENADLKSFALWIHELEKMTSKESKEK